MDSPPSILWVTDPWDCLEPQGDTTLRLAEEALRLGLECHWASSRGIRWQAGGVRVEAWRLCLAPTGTGLIRAPALPCSPSRFTSIHYRVDPPVDLAYIHPLQLLVLGLRSTEGLGPKTSIVNPAALLLSMNEKLEGGFFTDLFPSSVVASDWETLQEFGRVEGRTVLKPLNQAQGRGVELLEWTTAGAVARARKAIALATGGFTRPVLLQRFLEQVYQGEIRLWFVDGQLLACVLKIPQPGHFKVDTDAGARLEPYTLTAREREIAEELGRRLRLRGVRLAAVDLIAGFVTDFNITSPGLIREMEAVLGRNLAAPIIHALAAPAPCSEQGEVHGPYARAGARLGLAV